MDMEGCRNLINIGMQWIVADIICVVDLVETDYSRYTSPCSLETFESRSTILVGITVSFTNSARIRSGAATCSFIDCVNPLKTIGPDLV